MNWLFGFVCEHFYVRYPWLKIICAANPRIEPLWMWSVSILNDCWIMETSSSQLRNIFFRIYWWNMSVIHWCISLCFSVRVIWTLFALCIQHCRRVHNHYWSGVFNLLKFDYTQKKERKKVYITQLFSCTHTFHRLLKTHCFQQSLLLPLAAQPSASDSATGWHCAP